MGRHIVRRIVVASRLDGPDFIKPIVLIIAVEPDCQDPVVHLEKPTVRETPEPSDNAQQSPLRHSIQRLCVEHGRLLFRVHIRISRIEQKVVESLLHLQKVLHVYDSICFSLNFKVRYLDLRCSR